MLSNHPNCLGGNNPLESVQLDLSFGSTQGSIIYRSASDWVALTPGSSGQFLTTNGAAANPSWGTGTGVLPSQTSNSGKLLTTDGTNAAWTTTGVLTSLTSPAATNLTLAGGSGNTSIILTPAGTGNVGIGTTTPSDNLVVSNAGGAGLEIGVTTGSVINQAYKRSAPAGYVDYQDNCLNRIFYTNGSTEAMRLASTGNVSIASSTAGSASAGALVVTGGLSAGNNGNASYFGGAVSATVSSGPTLQINNVGTDKPYIGFYRGGTIRSALQLFTDNDFRFYSSDLSTYAAISAGAATFAGAVTVATGNLIIGTAGAGIDFSATAGTGTSELLNDYEEGTWTPTLSPATTGTITVASPNLCGYTKIGRVVTVNGLIEASAVSSPVGATVNIGGLPFPSNGNTNERSVGTVRAFSLTSGNLNSTATIASSTQTASLFIDASLFQATSQFYIQLTYTV